MNLKQAKSLQRGTQLHYTGRNPCSKTVGPHGGITIRTVGCRVSGEPKTWKRSPEKVQVPVKHGLYEHGYITESNLEYFHLATDCPLLREAAGHTSDPDLETEVIYDVGDE